MCSLIDEANSDVITNQRHNSLPALQNLPVCSFQPPLCPPEETARLALWQYFFCLKKMVYVCNNIVCFPYFRLKKLESHCMLCPVPSPNT